MDKIISLKKKVSKKHLFKTVYNKLDSALAEYKNFLGEKKIASQLKKTSKEIAARIEKNLKKEKRRQRKLENKVARVENKEVV